MVSKSLKQQMRDNCRRILYANETYTIGIDNRGYHLVLTANNGKDEAYAFFDDRIFEELTRTSVKRLEGILKRYGEEVLCVMRKKRLPLQDLGWACAKAIQEEQKDYYNNVSI